jgi:hypothetical protein
VPGQKILVTEALRAYTRGSAVAGFDEERLGELRPGFLADAVVLAEDVLEVPAEKIREVRVDLTIVGGRVVYERRHERQ